MATADATVTATSDITPVAITFIVTGHQHLTSQTTARSSDNTQTFTVQVTLQHGTWLVHAAGIHNADPAP